MTGDLPGAAERYVEQYYDGKVMANDRIGYIVEDAAYATPTFEAMGTPLQPGSAEKAIVHGLVELMSQY